MLDRYLIRNASVLDTRSGTRTKTDILVQNGIIAAMGSRLDGQGCLEADASGLIVTVGWVDCHAHIYAEHKNHIGVEPEQFLLPFGVTYAVDPGSAGAMHFSDFKKLLESQTDLKCKSFLNLSKIGVPIYGFEFCNSSDLDEAACERVFQENSSELLGIKIRINRKICREPLKILQTARQLCNRLGTRLCVHGTGCDLPTETIIGFLEKGDVLTHTYADTNSGILDEKGLVRQCVRKARERGVLFDMGHGSGSFSFRVAEQALAQDFCVDSISSDIHIANVNGPVFDLPTTLSKMLLLGVDLEETLRLVTVKPAEDLALSDKALSIRVGERADLTAFRLEEGEFAFVDSQGEKRIGKQRIASVFTCVGKTIFIPGTPRRENRQIGIPFK